MRGGFFCGREVFFLKEEDSSVLFLWQLADALVGARCCRRAHTVAGLMEKGSGYVGQVSGEETGWAAVECSFLSPVLHGPQVGLPAGVHPAPHWWMAEGI